MNAQPHKHQVRVGRQYPIINSGPYVVTYGDQEFRITWSRANPATKRFKNKVKRATIKAIDRHDKASIAAGIESNHIDKAQKEAAKIISKWK